MILVVVVKLGWKPQNWDVKHAFVNAELDVEVYMKLRLGCGERSGRGMKLERRLYGVKQAGRQRSALFCKTLADKIGMEQCRAKL